MLEEINCVVIGAGVIGLAIARELAIARQEVFILESTGAIGTGISSRNSEVIHAGIYYPPKTCKAKFCVSGKDLLYAYCADRQVPYKQIGKLIVATDEKQIHLLENYRKTAKANEVHDLQLLDKNAIVQMEPNISCVAALFSPSTGIVDSYSLMRALQKDAQEHGANLVFNSAIVSGSVEPSGIVLEVENQGTVRTKKLVIAGGLSSQDIAKSIHGVPQHTIPKLSFAKGHYFTMAGKSPFNRLIYPVAEKGGLGIHVTLDLAGQTRFGPDVSWVAQPNLKFEDNIESKLYPAIRRYFPDLKNGALQPAYVGVRPKLHSKEESFADFAIHGSETHGIKGLVSLYGIESPGLTSCLAIASHVTNMLAD